MVNNNDNVNYSIDQFTLSLSSKLIDSDWGTKALSIMQGIEHELGLNFFESIIDTNLPGYDYTRRFVCDNGAIFLACHTQHPNQGILLKFSAGGLREYLKNIGISILDIVERLEKLEYLEEVHFSRLDFAVDFFDDDRTNLSDLSSDIDKGIVSYYNAGNQRNKLKIKTISSDKEIQTIYFGARTSNLMIRCYDKRAQQLEMKNPEFYDVAKKCKSWVRFEAEIKHDLARKLMNVSEVCENDLEFEKKLASLVLSRFVLRKKSGEYHFVSEIFSEIANGNICSVVVENKNHNQDLERSKDWYKSDNAGLIGTLYKIKALYGEKAVVQYFSELYEALNKYKPTQSVIDWLHRNKVFKKKK